MQPSSRSPLVQGAAAVGAAIGQRDDLALLARQHHGYAVKINRRQHAAGDLVLGRDRAPLVRAVLEGGRIRADAQRVREMPTEPPASRRWTRPPATTRLPRRDARRRASQPRRRKRLPPS